MYAHVEGFSESELQSRTLCHSLLLFDFLIWWRLVENSMEPSDHNSSWPFHAWPHNIPCHTHPDFDNELSLVISLVQG